MTAPLTPADCDLRDFPGMMVDVARVRDSGLASDETPEACWAAFLLWAASWHQVPAGSIPDNDQWIAKHAGYAQRGKIDAKAWARVRAGALRNFVKCTDGLLYHPVVAEKALEAWLTKLASRLSSGAGNAKRWKIAFDPAPIEAQMKLAREMLSALNPHSPVLTKRKTSAVLHTSDQHPDGTPESIPPGSQEKGREGKGTDDSEAIASGGDSPPPPPASPPPPPDKPPLSAAEQEAARVWRALKEALVEQQTSKTTKDAGVLLGALASKYGKDVFLEAATTTVGANPVNAHTYLVGLCETAAGKRQSLNRQEAQEQRNRNVADEWARQGEPA